jgi:hypothetical protein
MWFMVIRRGGMWNERFLPRRRVMVKDIPQGLKCLRESAICPFAAAFLF